MTVHNILKNKLGYSYKNYYKRNTSKNNQIVKHRRAFFAHSLFCNYLQNEYFIITYDETGINQDSLKKKMWSPMGEPCVKYNQ